MSALPKVIGLVWGRLDLEPRFHSPRPNSVHYLTWTLIYFFQVRYDDFGYRISLVLSDKSVGGLTDLSYIARPGLCHGGHREMSLWESRVTCLKNRNAFLPRPVCVGAGKRRVGCLGKRGSVG